MGFEFPWLLCGIALAILPVLIHWWIPRPKQVVPWGAMVVLQRAYQRHRAQLQRRSLGLAAVRGVMLAAAAVGAAGFTRQSGEHAGGAYEVVRHLLLVDSSASLQAQSVTGRTIDQARAAAEAIVAAHPRDLFAILQYDQAGRWLIREPTSDRRVISRTIAALAATDCHCQSEHALSAATAWAEGRRGPHQLWVLSDFQEENWTAHSPGKAGTVSGFRRVTLVDVGAADLENVAVTEWQLPAGAQPMASEILCTAVIQNYGRQARPLSVEFVVDGVLHQSQTVTVTPGSPARVFFQWTTPTTEGESTVEVRIPADALSSDNRRTALLRTRRALRVLVIAAESEQPPYVAVALDPEYRGAGTSAREDRPFLVTVGAEIEAERSAWDVVIVDNPGELSREDGHQLWEFVRRGGGLVIAPGDRWRPELAAGAGEIGLLPTGLGQPIGTLDDPAPPTLWDHPPVHEIWSSLATDPASGLTTTRIPRRLLIESTPAPWRSVIDLTNGHPLIVETNLGEGKILFIATSLDGQWSSWPVWPSFAPLMHEIVRYCGRGADQPPTIVGQTTERRFLAADAPLSAEWQSPTGKHFSVPLRREARPTAADRFSLTAGDVVVTSPPSEETGVYHWCFQRRDGLQKEGHAVNSDPRESVLTKVPTRILLQSLPADTALVRHSSREAGTFERPADSARSGTWPARGPLTEDYSWCWFLLVAALFLAEAL